MLVKLAKSHEDKHHKKGENYGIPSVGHHAAVGAKYGAGLGTLLGAGIGLGSQFMNPFPSNRKALLTAAGVGALLGAGNGALQGATSGANIGLIRRSGAKSALKTYGYVE